MHRGRGDSDEPVPGVRAGRAVVLPVQAGFGVLGVLALRVADGCNGYGCHGFWCVFHLLSRRYLFALLPD